MKKILVIGGEGQLGRELVSLFDEVSFTSHKKDSPGFLQIEDRKDVQRHVDSISPDIIINAAAATNVDKCEEDHGMAYNINGLAVRNIVSAARTLDAELIHISTDYVFDGSKGNYSESDFPDPINYYGLSKLVGEAFAAGYDNSLIVRTSGVYGYKQNFPFYVVNNLKNGKKMDIMEGVYSPIHASNLAKAIISLANMKAKGIVNVGGDRISRMDFARSIAVAFDLDVKLLTEVEKFKAMKAERPYDSSLDISKASGLIDFDFHSIKSNLECFRNSYEKII